MRRTRGPPALPVNVATTVSPRRPGRVRPALDRRAETGQEVGRPSPPTALTPSARVAPAVDVDERCGGHRGSPEAPRRRPRAARRARSSEACPAGRSERPSARSLARGDALSCPDRATGRDPAAGRSQRLPARAGGQDRGRPRPPPDLVRPAGPRAAHARAAGRPCSRAGVARRRGGGRGLAAPSARSIMARAAAGSPSIARRIPGTGSSRSRGSARNGRSRSPRRRSHSPIATCRRRGPHG